MYDAGINALAARAQHGDSSGGKIEFYQFLYE
jgi:hypothetical protein